MFTGLVQSRGKVLRVLASGTEARLCIEPTTSKGAPEAFAALTPGESIAVNGACLSVESFDKHSFTAYASAETLRLTNLSNLKPGSIVNLERALCLGSRIGGHLVSGHVDAVVVLMEKEQAESSLKYRFSCTQELSRYIIHKGSVTVDGISLTVNSCGADFFEVNIIPDTQEQTTVPFWKPGQQINLEVDLIGKYVERMLAPWGQSGQGTGSAASAKKELDLEFFKSNGF